MHVCRRPGNSSRGEMKGEPIVTEAQMEEYWSWDDNAALLASNCRS